jgi:hypothetical protein
MIAGAAIIAKKIRAKISSWTIVSCSLANRGAASQYLAPGTVVRGGLREDIPRRHIDCETVQVASRAMIRRFRSGENSTGELCDTAQVV